MVVFMCVAWGAWQWPLRCFRRKFAACFTGNVCFGLRYERPGWNAYFGAGSGHFKSGLEQAAEAFDGLRDPKRSQGIPGENLVAGDDWHSEAGFQIGNQAGRPYGRATDEARI